MSENDRLRTDLDVEASLCLLTAGSDDIQHDYRPRTYRWYGTQRTSWVCVWCNAVACGDYGEVDPCWKHYHHDGPHKSRAGVLWPLGGNPPALAGGE